MFFVCVLSNPDSEFNSNASSNTYCNSTLNSNSTLELKSKSNSNINQHFNSNPNSTPSFGLCALSMLVGFSVSWFIYVVVGLELMFVFCAM